MGKRRIRIPNRNLETGIQPPAPCETISPDPMPRDAMHRNAIPRDAMPPDAMPPDAMHGDWESLVVIARRHAVLVLAGPSDERDSRLDACRLVWIQYAAAFGASLAAQARFADELQDVTRALIKEQQRAHHRADTAQVAAPIITIDELRPLLRQIIRQ